MAARFVHFETGILVYSSTEVNDGGTSNFHLVYSDNYDGRAGCAASITFGLEMIVSGQTASVVWSGMDARARPLHDPISIARYNVKLAPSPTVNTQDSVDNVPCIAWTFEVLVVCISTFTCKALSLGTDLFLMQWLTHIAVPDSS
jgi:hypothetical protein